MKPNYDKRSNNNVRRPSARDSKYYINNVVSPKTKAAQNKSEKQKQERQARVLGTSLNKKTEKDFRSGSTITGLFNGSIKKIFVMFVIALTVLAVGISIGIFVFVISTSAKLSIDDTAKAKLMNTSNSQTSYVLFAVDVDNDEKQIPDIYNLTRIDVSENNIILINIPAKTYVASTYGGATTFDSIYAQHGDAGIIESVGILTEISINHYVKCSSDGFFGLIDEIGGINVDLKESIDDYLLCDEYIPQGDVTLNGNHAKAVLSYTKFNGGYETISSNQRQICTGVLKSCLYNNFLNIPMLIDKMAGSIKTDFSVGDIIALINDCSKFSEDSIKDVDFPCYKSIRNNNMVYITDVADWKKLRAQISNGVVPINEKNITVSDINPSQVTVLIQNGAGIDGAASMLSDKLNSLGFNVIGTQNAESSAYTETLIIARNDETKNIAYAIKNSINNGRVVNGDGVYNISSDILIIIGQDLKI